MHAVRDYLVPASPISPSPDQGSECLQQVIQSKLFARSQTLSALLLYLWENREQKFSEYAIAIDALGRRQDFEPKTDATVRVQISRLRKRLAEFYGAEGSHLRFRIEIPLGTHQIQIIEVSQSDDEPPSEEKLPQVVPSVRRLSIDSKPIFLIGAALLLVLAGCIAWKLLFPREGRNVYATVQASRFWNETLNNGKPTRIVVPTPTFFLWGSSSTTQLMARDPQVNDFSELNDSNRLQALKNKYGVPELAQAYTSAPDTFALLKLAHYFDLHGMQMLVSGTNDSSFESLDHENLIVLGTSRTLVHFQPYINDLSFQLDPRQEAVIDRRPVAGRPARFDTIRESPIRQVSPGIIAVLPGGHSGTRIVLVISNFNTSALVAYLTSEDGLQELERAREADGNSPYFEAVILSEINGTTPVRSWLGEFRRYTPPQA